MCCFVGGFVAYIWDNVLSFRQLTLLALVTLDGRRAHVQISDKLNQNLGKVIHARNLTLSILAHTAAHDNPLCCRALLLSSNAGLFERGIKDGEMETSKGQRKMSSPPILLLPLPSCNRSFLSASGFWMISSIPNASTFNNLFQS